MLTLSPGPSQISRETKRDIHDAVQDGVLELSHRSSRFTDISRLCVEELRRYLKIPKDYRVFYFDSATQVWHSMAANLVHQKSFHFINGAFSAKARDASKLLGKDAQSVEVPWGDQNDFKGTIIPSSTELISACLNETSTGVKMTNEEVRILREKNPRALIAIDITSCSGNVPLTLSDGDVWYFSVQKAFGLPAGLGVGIVSPRAYERSTDLAKSGKNLAGIWSWEKLDEMMQGEKYQTPHTPNVLKIYLLAKQCERWNKDGGLTKRVAETKTKKKLFETWMRERRHCDFFVNDAKHRSDTVFVIQAEPDTIAAVKKFLHAKGVELGEGYGKIKKNTFRIANFPAISETDLQRALNFMAKPLDK
jgi:phosphoserine aminotransferase